LFRETGDKPDVARSIYSLGYVALHQEDADLAETCFQESLAMFRELGNKRGIAECLVGFASRAIEKTQYQRAGRLLGAATSLLGTLNAAWWPADRVEYKRNLAAIQATLAEDEFAEAWSEGQAMTLEDALAYAFNQAVMQK